MSEIVINSETVRRLKDAAAAILISYLKTLPDEFNLIPDVAIEQNTGLDFQQQIRSAQILAQAGAAVLEKNYSMGWAVKINSESAPEKPESLSVYNNSQNQVEQIIEGLRRRMRLNILPEEQLWIDAASYALINNFTAEHFLECYDLLCRAKWRRGRLKPEIVKNHLHEIERLRLEDASTEEAQSNNGRAKRKSNAEIAKEYEDYFRARFGQ